MRYEGADVAIVGGGIVGASLAVELASRKLKVTLFERTAIAAGASGRNSGVVWHPADPVMAALHVETLATYRALPARLAEELGAARRAFGEDGWEDDDPTGADRGDVEDGAGADPGAPLAFRLGARPAGVLALGRDAAALRARAEADAATLPALGATFLDADAVRSLEPGVAAGLAAIRYDIGFPVAPAGATRAMAALARALGADVREGRAGDVQELARYGDIVGGVVTADGSVHPAGFVVVAAGPWTPGLIDPTGSWRPIRPAWGVVVELDLGEAAPRHVLEAADADEVGTDDADAPAESGFSLVTAGGRSALGSTSLPDQPDPAAWSDALRARGARYVPAVAAAPATGLRACARPVTPDGRPLVGAVPGFEGLYVAAGHGPWGLSTGPASAAHVAALLAGEPDPRPASVLDGTRADRFGAPSS